MGLWEKKRCRNFFIYIAEMDFDDEGTWKGIDVNSQPMSDVFKKFKLEDNTIDFIGHAVALFNNDQYLDEPASDCIKKIQLYMDSIGRYGDHPFLYPIYGLGGIPEGFTRFCAIHGGTYMLNQDIDEVVFDASGKVEGVKAGDKIAKAPLVICDPSYVKNLSGMMQTTKKLMRKICILSHPIPNTGANDSCQIIIPQKQTGR